MYPLLEAVFASECRAISRFIQAFLVCLTGRSASSPAKQREVDIHIQTVLLNIRPCSHTVMLSLKYVHRFVNRFPPSKLHSSFSIFHLWLAAIIHADVFNNDNAFSINSWSKVSGESKKSIVNIRREFVSSLAFDMHCSQEEFTHWMKTVEAFVRSRRKQQGADTLPSPEEKVFSPPTFKA